METLGNDLVAKSGKKWQTDYYCEKCDYKCSKIYNWKKHLLTAKHGQEMVGNSKSIVNSSYSCLGLNQSKVCFNPSERVTAGEKLSFSLASEMSDTRWKTWSQFLRGAKVIGA